MKSMVLDMAGTLLIMAGIAAGTVAACRVALTARFSSSGSCWTHAGGDDASMARALRLLARARMDERTWEDAL